MSGVRPIIGAVRSAQVFHLRAPGAWSSKYIVIVIPKKRLIVGTDEIVASAPVGVTLHATTRGALPTEVQRTDGEPNGRHRGTGRLGDIHVPVLLALGA